MLPVTMHGGFGTACCHAGASCVAHSSLCHPALFPGQLLLTRASASTGGWVTAMSPQALGQVQPLQRQPWDQAADAGAVPDAAAAEGGLHPAPEGSPEGHAGAAAGQVSVGTAGTAPGRGSHWAGSQHQ